MYYIKPYVFGQFFLTVFLMVVAFLGIAYSVSAQSAVACTNLSHGLYFGATDASTGGDVTSLQIFLQDQGFFQAKAIGIFGPLTLSAVERFQTSQNISAIGLVGPLTRTAIRSISCGTNSSLSIQSISPSSGPVGTTVSISGWGFTDDNMIHFGAGVIAHVPVTSSVAIACTTDPSCHPGIRQVLEFTVPSSVGPYCPPGAMCPMYLQLVTAGAYNISVQNNNGTSNNTTFTVTDTSMSNKPPIIVGIDTPATLSIGTVGTWTVHSAIPSGSTTNLHYGVVWGDEVSMANGNIMAPQATTVQSSATFTHTYQRSGTYTATFTVSDDSGHSSSVSSTVTVTPIY